MPRSSRRSGSTAPTRRATAPQSAGEGTDVADPALLHEVEEDVGLPQSEPRPGQALAAEARPAVDVHQLGTRGRERTRSAAQHGGGNHLSILVRLTFPDSAGGVTILPHGGRLHRRARSPSWRAPGRLPCPDQEARASATG